MSARTIVAMVRKDLLRKLRSPLGVLGALLFPVLFATMIGITFGEGDAPPRTLVLVRNDDGGPLGNFVLSALTSDRAAEFLDVVVVERDGEDLLESRGASALLIVPERFSERVLEGEPTALALVRNPAQGIFPEILEQLAGVLAEGLDAASHALRGPLDRIAGLTSDGASPADADLVALTLEIRDTLEGAGSLVFPPAITLETATAEGADDDANGPGDLFLAFLPGVSVYALFLLGDLAMRDLLVEADAGTLRRQLAGPVRGATVIAGKAAFAGTLALVGLAVLAAIGAGFVRAPVDPGGFVALALALTLAIVGTCAAIYGAAGTQRRGAVIGSVLFLVLAFLGGAFTAQQLPAAVRAVAPVSPLYWGTDGFRILIREGGGLVAIATHLAVLSAIGVVLLAVGATLLDRRVRRGAAS